VDDDEAVRDALLNLLQVEGLNARGYASADAFLVDLVSTRFDCLITDVRMPRMGGLALQNCLREMGSRMPVIFVTSAEDEVTQMQAMEAGATAYFTKPLANSALLRQLFAALGWQSGS
jgi:FixJ family two-component response regulator